MKKLMQSVMLGVLAALLIFGAVSIAIEAANGGRLTYVNWSFSKMFFGTLVVGIGFSVPTMIYEKDSLPLAVRSMIHMGTGVAIMLITACVVGWIPFSSGWKICAAVIAGEVLSAVGIWSCLFFHYKKVAKQMNERIGRMEKDR